MTDRYTVYTKVLKMLKQMITIGSRGHLVTLAMMIAGIVTGRNAQLSAMSSEIDVAAKEKRIEMRLRRWVKHSQIDTEVVYLPFARQILEALVPLGLVLVTDGRENKIRFFHFTRIVNDRPAAEIRPGIAIDTRHSSRFQAGQLEWLKLQILNPGFVPAQQVDEIITQVIHTQ